MRRQGGLLVGITVGALVMALQHAEGYETQHPAMVLDLDGTAWNVTVQPSPEARQQGEKPFKDTLEFHDHKVGMSACLPRGFSPSIYSTAPIGDNRWMFKTDQESPTAGKTFWNGDILEGTIRGDLIWAKPSGVLMTYTFSGVQVKRAGR